MWDGIFFDIKIKVKAVKCVLKTSVAGKLGSDAGPTLRVSPHPGKPVTENCVIREERKYFICCGNTRWFKQINSNGT